MPGVQNSKRVSLTLSPRDYERLCAFRDSYDVNKKKQGYWMYSSTKLASLVYSVLFNVIRDWEKDGEFRIK